MNQNKHLLLLLSTLSFASHLTVKPKAGINVSQLHLGAIAKIKQPVLEIENPVFLYKNKTNYAANSFLFNSTGTRGSVSKDNIDGAFLTQYLAGIQLSYSNESDRPSDSFSYAPVINLYALIADKSKQSIQANRFVIEPYSTGGLDVGLELAKNGSYIQFGVGGQMYRCQYESGLLLAAMAQIRSASVDLADINTLSLIKADNTSYTVQVDPFIMPYAYTEINTEIGDMLSAFVKLSYGFNTPPKFKNADPTIEMFAKDPASFAASSDWQMHSASLGLKIRLEDLF